MEIVFISSAFSRGRDFPKPTPVHQPMTNPVIYFEIPVSDIDRAVHFYTAVFGTTLERTEIDGHPMALFPARPGSAGATGALAQGRSYVPGRQGVRVYFAVESIEETLRRVIASGGTSLYPRTSIGDLGWVAEFEDTEGNCIALHESR